MIADVTESDLLAERSELSIEERFTLLADPHRRVVIGRLDEVPGGLTIESLADHVTSELADGTLGTDDRRRRVLLSLHHNHLPRLADHGVLQYDPAAGTVSAA
jgi:hypothetical protein